MLIITIVFSLGYLESQLYVIKYSFTFLLLICMKNCSFALCKKFDIKLSTGLEINWSLSFISLMKWNCSIIVQCA